MSINLEAEMQSYKKRKLDNKGKQLSNWQLPDGSAFYFYCLHCGTCTDIVPEDHIYKPDWKPAITVCSGCKELEDRGMFN